VAFIPASMWRRILVRYRSFGRNYCRHQGVKKKKRADLRFISVVFSCPTVFHCLQRELCSVNKRKEPVISPSPIFYAFLSRRRMVSVGCSYPSPHSAHPSATSFGEITLWSLLSATTSYQMVFSIFTAAYLSCLFLTSFLCGSTS